MLSSSSVGKESTCSAGDLSSIPGSGRSTGEGILQYFGASLVAQLLNNPPAMRETWVRSLGWEDNPGDGKGYPLQYSGLENSMDCILSPWGRKESDKTELNVVITRGSKISEYLCFFSVKNYCYSRQGHF